MYHVSNFVAGLAYGLWPSGRGLVLIVAVVFVLVMLPPLLAASVRRAHDLGYSGWTVLLGLVPVVSIGFLLVLLLQPGDKSANRYGPNPLALPVAP